MTDLSPALAALYDARFEVELLRTRQARGSALHLEALDLVGELTKRIEKLKEAQSLDSQEAASNG